MSRAPLATERMVRAAAESAWEGEDRRVERLLVLRAVPRWDGPATLTGATTTYRVVAARSTLGVRAALAEAGSDDRLVVLTDVTDDELGIGVLAHAVRQRSSAMDVWDAVRQAFRARGRDVLDSNLVRDGEAFGRALVDHAPAAGWPPPPGGILTRDHAYRSLLSEVVGLEPQRLDVAGLLDWTRGPQAMLDLHRLDPEISGPLVGWLNDRLGAVAKPVLDLGLAGHGTDAIALGLVAGHLYGTGGTERGQGAFEQKHFSRRLTKADVKPWAEAARGWVERGLLMRTAETRQVLDRAEQVLVEVQGEGAASTSPLLPGGLVGRQAALGKALVAALPGLGESRVRSVEAAWSALEAHGLAEAEPALQEPALMAVRLVRWLADEEPVSPTLHDALVRQVEVGGWVDRARQVIWNGTSEPTLGQGLAKVFAATTEVRRRSDRHAATLLASSVATEQAPGSVIPVEEALARVVVPLVSSGPVLLLVLDGMSAAVACEVMEDVVTLGWDELVRAGRRGVLLAGLPSVTAVSRTSLLTGKLQKGGQAEEKRGLPLVTGEGSVVYHLADLAGVAGSDVPLDVRDAVLDPSRPVVAAVLNAVDDSLSGGDPARTRWDVDAVRHLRPLLERAALAGRTVVMVSDHGHVVDKADSGTLRSATGGGARWRPGGNDDVKSDEVLLSGPRVVLGEGKVIAAVDEGLRYRARNEGYHGGAAMAELAIPALVMVRRGSPRPPGWESTGRTSPDWWIGPAVPAVADDHERETLF